MNCSILFPNLYFKPNQKEIKVLSLLFFNSKISKFNMKKISILLLLNIIAFNLFAQPGSDIYLFHFRLDDDNFYISNAKNITDSPGYDNQPSFTPDGNAILFSSGDGFGQTDIFKYDLSSKSERRLTYSPESEYSPMVTPDSAYISCVILKRDGEQKLWKYPKNGAIPQIIINKDKVGYYTWLNDSSIYAFVLGTPNTLQSISTSTKKITQVASYLGVTLQKIPHSEKISYVDMSNKKHWIIKSYDPSTNTTHDIIKTVNAKNEYYTWTPSGVLLSGDGKTLYKFNPKSDTDWVELADLSEYGIENFTRLAVSPNSNLIAIVVTE